ncbi:MAG: transcription-repair coupling factor, partial [Alphaproteobacteria bacterium]|nr:transcription-repair coupling factor [Alphaproteobacteria bacterium]
KPLRMDLFGDEIESIKAFDPATQRTEEKIADFALQPACEFFLDKDSISRFRAGYREAFGVVQGGDPLYEAVSEGRRYNGMEHWLPLFYEKMDTLFDYAPGAGVTMDYHALEACTEREDQIRDFYEARKTLEEAAAKKTNKKQELSGAVYHPVRIDTLYIGQGEWKDLSAEALVLSPFGAPEGIA